MARITISATDRGMRLRYAAALVVMTCACTTTSEPADAGPDGSMEAASDVALDAPADAGCFTAYEHPGCDAASTVLCGPQDACAYTFCDCNNVTFVGGCGFADKPFEHFGACGDAGTD